LFYTIVPVTHRVSIVINVIVRVDQVSESTKLMTCGSKSQANSVE